MTGSSRASDTRKAERQSVAKERRAYNGIRFTKPPSRQGKTIDIDQRHRKRGRRLHLHRVVGPEQQGPQSRQQGGGATSARNGPINGIQAELRGAYIAHQQVVCPRFITDEIATTPYAGRVLVGAQEAARKLGYILLTVNTGNDRELENQEIAALRQYRVDGFLYAMMYHRVVEIPAELEGSPTVVVDSEDENRKIPSIYPDDEMAGYDATNRLIQAGCKRIVYYGSSITIIAQGERFAGYRRALADAGIPFDEQLVVNVEEATNAASEAGRVFDEIKPDGIFCFNDVRATFIYEAARERSVGIGTDVSVISIDNQPLITDVLKPALTTLELPHYEMGFKAVHQLVAMIDDEAATESLARSEDSIRRSENGPMTPLRCRIIERDSIVS